MWDIIVIGAGPAGCTAAKTLSEQGYKVLMVEKFKLPRYKSCSGVLIKKTIDLVRLYFNNEEVPQSAACEPVQNRGMIFTNAMGKEYRFEQEGLNVWRSGFDGWLAEKAKEYGTEIRDCTTAVSASEEEEAVAITLYNNGKKYTERAKYIIDCEGVTGAVKRTVINYKPEYIITFQTFNEAVIELDSHYFYAYLQPELSEYDAWFNVKDNLLVLGVAVRDMSKIDFYYNNFISYMKSQHNLQIENQVKEEKWIMPYISSPLRIDYGVNRILFAGEAAGFLNPMGEGISAGMESGYCAAKAVSCHFNDLESVYSDYKNSTQKLKTYMERQWNLVERL